jgi:hypothetical protein
MTSVRTMTAGEFVEQVAARLAAEPHRPGHNDFDAASRPVPPAAYALIVGAGFSRGVVPMVRQLMHETVGDFYFPDQDQSSMKRAPEVLQRHSADFWSEFNRAAGANDLPLIEVDGDGLPADPGTTYQALFTYEGVNALFAMKEPESRTTWRTCSENGTPYRGLTRMSCSALSTGAWSRQKHNETPGSGTGNGRR